MRSFLKSWIILLVSTLMVTIVYGQNPGKGTPKQLQQEQALEQVSGIRVENGVLVFQSYDQLGITLNNLLKGGENTQNSFERRFRGFTSTRTYYNSILQMATTDNQRISESVKAREAQFFRNIYVNQEEELLPLVYDPALATVVNKEGKVKIGSDLLQFTLSGLLINGTPQGATDRTVGCDYNKKIFVKVGSQLKFFDGASYRLTGAITYLNLPTLQSFVTQSVFTKRKRIKIFKWYFWMQVPTSANVLTTGGSCSGFINGSSFSVPYGQNTGYNKNSIIKSRFFYISKNQRKVCFTEGNSKHTASKSGQSFIVNLSF